MLLTKTTADFGRWVGGWWAFVFFSVTWPPVGTKGPLWYFLKIFIFGWPIVNFSPTVHFEGSAENARFEACAENAQYIFFVKIFRKMPKNAFLDFFQKFVQKIWPKQGLFSALGELGNFLKIRPHLYKILDPPLLSVIIFWTETILQKFLLKKMLIKQFPSIIIVC